MPAGITISSFAWANIKFNIRLNLSYAWAKLKVKLKFNFSCSLILA